MNSAEQKFATCIARGSIKEKTNDDASHLNYII